MTVVEKSHYSDNYYITLEVEEGRYGFYYEVQVCPRIGENECGYPVRSMTYSMKDRAKALATYRRYIKKYV